MQISGLGNNVPQVYQAMRTAQQKQSPVQQTSNNVNQAAAMNVTDPDHDGDIDGKGKDIDVRV